VLEKAAQNRFVEYDCRFRVVTRIAKGGKPNHLVLVDLEGLARERTKEGLGITLPLKGDTRAGESP
jgi:hypothetical protein